MARTTRGLIAGLAVAVFAGGSGSAIADIDPASDVLPLQDTFLPYDPKVCPQLSTALRTLTARSERAGYPVKVAVIASKADLGGASTLFGDPKAYARFLAQELVTYAPQAGVTYDNPPLLVVMPAGFGLDHGGRKADQVVGELSFTAIRPNDLVRAALDAIPRLARAEGHRVAAPKVQPDCSNSGGATSVLVYLAPLVLLPLFVLLAVSRRRPRPS